jgi:hypothetical protein
MLSGQAQDSPGGCDSSARPIAAGAESPSLRRTSIPVQMARVTGLEPATSGVTGRHSNQLSYTRASRNWSESVYAHGPGRSSSLHVELRNRIEHPDAPKPGSDEGTEWQRTFPGPAGAKDSGHRHPQQGEERPHQQDQGEILPPAPRPGCSEQLGVAQSEPFPPPDPLVPQTNERERAISRRSANGGLQGLLPAFAPTQPQAGDAKTERERVRQKSTIEIDRGGPGEHKTQPNAEGARLLWCDMPLNGRQADAHETSSQRLASRERKRGPHRANG